MSRPYRYRVVLPPLAATLPLVLAVAGCASARAPAGPSMAVFLEVNNDITPPADLEIFLYPVGGDVWDRIEVGVVDGASTEEFDITVQEGGWYYLRALRVVDIPDAPYPMSRGRATTEWRSRRFTVRSDTRRLEWIIDTNSLTIHGGESGGP
ncbi:MAG TPA: hypothetical protein VLA43_05785 [Longimicrobiales bacterium]|nr:hypothetical protein [Longimicrobiales bacterium]